MDVQCRPMKANDFGVVECGHWASAQQVQQYIDRQGIASMLAFTGDKFLGQLYLQEYDPKFKNPGGWYGERPWADFHSAQLLALEGRFLTLGCYHVQPESRGQRVGATLLKAVIE